MWINERENNFIEKITLKTFLFKITSKNAFIIFFSQIYNIMIDVLSLVSILKK